MGAMDIMDPFCPLQAAAGEDAADEALRTFLVSKLAVDVTVCFLTLAGNALTISALLHQRWCRKETLCPRFKVSSLFVMNLAVADFLIGLSILFFLVAHYVCSVAEHLSRNRFLCILKTATFMFSGVISTTTLAAISIDRYVAVVHSLRYQEYMTRRRAAAIISMTWVVGLLGAGSLFFWNHFEYGRPCLDTVLPRRHIIFIGMPLNLSVLSVILVAHLRIRHEIQLMRARRKVCANSIWGAQVQSSSIKSMRAVVLVIGCFVVCYLPFMCVFMVRLVGTRSRGLDLAFQCLASVTNLNPMLNPFIYSWKNASVRNALRQFIEKVQTLARGGRRGAARAKPPFLASATATSLSASGASGASTASSAATVSSSASSTASAPAAAATSGKFIVNKVPVRPERYIPRRSSEC